jgi:hypothetical protein
MNSQDEHMDRLSAAVMNLIAGFRVEFGAFGKYDRNFFYLDDMPEENRLMLKDTAGQILASADVRIYQSQLNEPLFGKFFDNEPDLSCTSDANGQVLVGKNPFTSGGHINSSNWVIVIRVEHEGRVGYTFMESAWFNLAYWRGETELADYEIEVNLVM